MAAKTRKARVPQVLRQTFGPFKGMRTTVEETASDPRLVQYALNMTCADPEHGGAYTVRPPAVQTSGMPASGRARFFHVLETLTNPIPVGMSGQGELYSLQGETAWGLLVSAADFAAAGIGLDGTGVPYYALTFAGKMVVSDGVNPPWMWDGTAGSAGLTLLSNCPPLYGPMTEYAGKLFGIKAEDHHTIVWSEENDPATGYEAGGFNNAWTISQQADTPLVGLCGRNDGLYYWRTQGFGMISGAVAGDFRTTHTHDALSSTVGLAGPAAFVDSGDALWWYGSSECIYVYPIGGQVQDVSPEITPQHSAYDPVPQRWQQWARRGVNSHGVPWAASTRVALIGPNDVNDRLQVWFSLPGVHYVSTIGGIFNEQDIILVYDVATRRPLSWYSRNAPSAGLPFPAGPFPAGPLVHSLTRFTNASRPHGRFAVAWDANIGAPIFWHWQPILTVGDGLEDGAPVAGTLIGPIAGGDTMAEQAWLRLDAVCLVPALAQVQPLIQGTAFGTLTVDPYTVLTSVIPTQTQFSTGPNPPKTVTATFRDPAPFVPGNTNQLWPSNQHAVFGLDEVARTLRLVFTLQWTTSVGIHQGFGLERYSLLSTGITEDPDAP